MSYTTKIGNFSFIHNGDFSGEVIITDTSTGHKMIVPGNILMSIIAEMIRQREIERWENLEPEEILGG